VDPISWQLITVDVDGTLTRGHGWRPIAAAFGRLAPYEDTDRRFLAHEIGEDEHLKDLLNLAAGHTTAEVERIVDATPRLDGIAEGVRSLQELGARVALLTHNPPYVTGYYRRTFGFDDVEGIDAQAIVNGRIGPAQGVRSDKLEGLRRLLGRNAAESHRTVHVGDGWADMPVFRAVGGAVALNATRAEVREAADIALSADDFRKATDAIRRLTPRG
jgi:phosphoserine phosphatase